MALSIKAEELASVSNFEITNSLITSIIIISIIILFYVTYSNKLKLIPNKKQLFLEYIIEGISGLTQNILGKEISKLIFPLIFTFFIFILSSNWFGLLPITGSIGWAKKSEENALSTMNLVIDLKDEFNLKFDHYEIIPFLRSPSADLNFTIALAIISFLIIQYISIKKLGVNYLAKFFDYRVKILNGEKVLLWKKVLLIPIYFILNFLWKTLELILELSKIVSFSFRLFGNIFAGEVLLAVITMLTFGILTLPFLGFEIFIGFIQAIVFIFLTMVFIRVNLDSHHH